MMKKEEMEKVVIELHYAIVGNGTKGLAERIKELENKLEKLSKDMYKYIYIATGAGCVIGGACAVIGFLIEKLIK